MDYLQDPTSYDGEYSIADLHPSMRSRDLYPAMRDLTDEDLELMSAYILVAPKVLGQEWGRRQDLLLISFCRSTQSKSFVPGGLRSSGLFVGDSPAQGPWSWDGGCTTTPADPG